MNLKTFFAISFILLNIGRFVFAGGYSQGVALTPAVKIYPDSENYKDAMKLYDSLMRKNNVWQICDLLDNGKAPYGLLLDPEYTGEITDALKKMTYQKLYRILFWEGSRDGLNKDFFNMWFDPFLKSMSYGHIRLLEKMTNINKYRLTFAVSIAVNKKVNNTETKLAKKDKMLAYLINRIGFSNLPPKLQRFIIFKINRKQKSFPKTSRAIGKPLKNVVEKLQAFYINLKNVGFNNFFTENNYTDKQFAALSRSTTGK